MNYKKMWEELKTKVEKDLDFYKSGIACYLMESIHGTANCESILKDMKELENKYS